MPLGSLWGGEEGVLKLILARSSNALESLDPFPECVDEVSELLYVLRQQWVFVLSRVGLKH